MGIMRISCVQMQSSDSLAENLEKIVGHIERGESDMALFPLRALTGPLRTLPMESLDKAWSLIAAAARRHYTTVLVNTLNCETDKAYIQTRIYEDDGELAGTQEKLVPTIHDREWCTPGSELNLFQKNGLSYGCLCGNDLWVAPGLGNYPDRRLTAQLGERGARVLFHSADSGTDPRYREYYESNLKLRAWEAGCYSFTANAAPAQGELNAPTCVVSPEGRILDECPRTGEHVLRFDLELDEIEG